MGQPPYQLSEEELTPPPHAFIPGTGEVPAQSEGGRWQRLGIASSAPPLNLCQGAPTIASEARSYGKGVDTFALTGLRKNQSADTLIPDFRPPEL